MASNEDWKDVDSEEEDRLMTQLCDHRAQKQEKKVTKVPSNFTTNDIETTMGWLDREVSQFCKADHCPIDGRAAEEACQHIVAAISSTYLLEAALPITLPHKVSSPQKAEKPSVTYSSPPQT